MRAAHDLVIRGGLVLDGSGAPGREADVAIRGDRIAAVGKLPPGSGPELDARGLAVAPGFIDVHSHDDAAVLLHPQMEFKVRQGVTTEIVGNCGMGPAPGPQARAFFRAVHPSGELPPFEDHAGYLARLEESPPALNVGVLAGHGTLRSAALAEPRGPASAAERSRMRALLAEGLEAGVLGLSTGLIYEPGRHAGAEELTELAHDVARAGGIYTTHMRDEGTGLLDSVRETLAVAEATGVRVQISHHKAAGRPAWGLTAHSLALLEEARGRGLAAAADQYPYTSASTVLAAVLGAVGEGAEHAGLAGIGGQDVILAAVPGARELEGRTLASVAEDLDLPLHEAAREVLRRAPATWVILEMMDEEDVRRVLVHETTMIGSDGVPTLEARPHPRLSGTFPRVLGRYAREAGLLALEEAVHKMTGLPAATFGLRDRGFVREGAFADLVLFDPAEVEDTATVADPFAPPRGIPFVFVNGTAVVRNGEPTAARPGRALRRAGS